MEKYVAGFIGNDGYLGRTFLANGMTEAMQCIRDLIAESKDTVDFEDTHFEDECVLKSDLGNYFIGGLEEK